jgi:uncharacterized protein YjbJ (UPF0337 family)
MQIERLRNLLPIQIAVLKENIMKTSTKDQLAGKFHEVKGRAKEIAGKLSDNPKLAAEGTLEKVSGKIQEKIGQVKMVLGK